MCLTSFLGYLAFEYDLDDQIDKLRSFKWVKGLGGIMGRDQSK